MNNEKYLVTIEFRYLDAPKHDHDFSHNTKTITIGVFDNFEDACNSGNKVLENDFESRFELNKNWNRKERFSKNKTLITDLAYLKTPFVFFAEITKLNHSPIEKMIDNVIEARNRYKDYKLNEND